MSSINSALTHVYYLAQSQDVGTVTDKVDTFNQDLLLIAGGLLVTAVIIGVLYGVASGKGAAGTVKIVLNILLAAFLLGIGAALIGWFIGIGQGYAS